MGIQCAYPATIRSAAIFRNSGWGIPAVSDSELSRFNHGLALHNLLDVFDPPEDLICLT